MNEQNQGTERLLIRMESRSQNEAFARAAVAAFMVRMDPTVEEIEDVKTAVSEAVSNSILHGYPDEPGEIRMELLREGKRLRIEVTDYGRGIADVRKARQPLYTTCPGSDRSGMGFYFMEAFMESVDVESQPEQGTKVILTKTIGRR